MLGPYNRVCIDSQTISEGDDLCNLKFLERLVFVKLYKSDKLNLDCFEGRESTAK